MGASAKFSPLEWCCVWLAGAGHETLSQCPDWERRKHAAFGATVLIPTAFGALASAYAASTLTNIPAIIIGVSVLWSFIILTIDRAFLAAYRPTLPPFQKTTQFFLRFSIALLMGLTVAHPLVLLLFNDAVAIEIKEQQAQKLVQTRGELSEQSSILNAEIGRLNTQLTDLRTQHRATFEPVTLPELSAGQGTAQDFASQIALLDTQIQSQEQQAQILREEIKEFEKRIEMELAGLGPSGEKGHGPATKNLQRQIDDRKPTLTRIHQILTDLTDERTKLLKASTAQALDPQLAELQQQKAQARQHQMAQMMAAQAELRGSLQRQIDGITAQIADQQSQQSRLLDQLNAETDADPPRDLITRTFALHSLFHKEGGAFALSAYVVLSLVFMLLDTIPLVAKFSTKAGPYDQLIAHQEKTFDPAGISPQIPEPPAPSEEPVIEPSPAEPLPPQKARPSKKRPVNYERATGHLRATINGTAQEIKKPSAITLHHIDLSMGHPLTNARHLKRMLTLYKSKGKLAQAVNVSSATLSKYFKLLTMSPPFQDALEAIQDLNSIELAYRIALVPSEEHRMELLSMLAEGANQAQIRVAIAELNTTQSSTA